MSLFSLPRIDLLQPHAAAMSLMQVGFLIPPPDLFAPAPSQTEENTPIRTIGYSLEL
jgi:hypothetical protein